MLQFFIFFPKFGLESEGGDGENGDHDGVDGGTNGERVGGVSSGRKKWMGGIKWVGGVSSGRRSEWEE